MLQLEIWELTGCIIFWPCLFCCWVFIFQIVFHNLQVLDSFRYGYGLAFLNSLVELTFQEKQKCFWTNSACRIWQYPADLWGELWCGFQWFHLRIYSSMRSGCRSRNCRKWEFLAKSERVWASTFSGPSAVCFIWSELVEHKSTKWEWISVGSSLVFETKFFTEVFSQNVFGVDNSRNNLQSKHAVLA